MYCLGIFHCDDQFPVWWSDDQFTLSLIVWHEVWYEVQWQLGRDYFRQISWNFSDTPLPSHIYVWQSPNKIWGPDHFLLISLWFHNICTFWFHNSDDNLIISSGFSEALQVMRMPPDCCWFIQKHLFNLMNAGFSRNVLFHWNLLNHIILNLLINTNSQLEWMNQVSRNLSQDQDFQVNVFSF